MAAVTIDSMSPRRRVAAAAMLWPLAFGPLGPAAPPDAPPSATAPTALDMEGFLDRLMVAESGGRNDARNPRSTALGPYQFIESTWLDLVRRLYAAEIQGKTPAQILALRMDRDFARKAARAYTLENAATLAANGFDATFPRLRLAFLLGPQGAVRVLAAPPQTRVTALLGPRAANANPFMYGLTAEGLIARAAHDLAVSPATLAGVASSERPAAGAATKAMSRVVVRCNLALMSCRRWQALAIARAKSTPPPRKKIAGSGR
jgi:hypothetical protein